MGGKLGLGVRAVLAVALGVALLFGVVENVNADPTSYTVSIGNAASQAEGDSPGQNHLTFPLTVAPGAAPTDITVTYTVNGGSAQTTTIAHGNATAQLQVPIAGNTTAQDDQTYTVVITKVEFAATTTDTVAIGSVAQGTGTVIDDDWRIAGLVSDPANATVTEAGNKVIDFQVKLVDPTGASVNAPAHHKITVDYVVADGTPAGLGSAVNGTNYSVTDPSGKTSGTLTFAPGTSVVHVKVTSLDDGVYGLDKQFTVTVKNPQGATFAAGATTGETGTITESEAPPVLGLIGCTGTVGAGGDAVFTLTDSFASLVPATVNWKTSDVSTVAGDYDGGSGTATIAAGNGNRTGTVTIHTHVNAPGGATRTFQLTVSNPQHATLLNGAASLSATCDIAQPTGAGSDKQPSIQLTDPAPVPQPATGSTPVTVKVTLNAPTVQPPTPQAVDVQWSTQPGTAVSPADYSDASGTLHWDKGVFGAQTFTVNVNAANGNATTPKTFTIKFLTTSAVFVGASVVTVTVVPPAAPPVLATADASALESAGSIPAVVSLAPAATGTVTVKYATADGTATAGSDYSAVSGTLTFTPGQTSKTVSIPISNNAASSGNKTFTFNLSAPTGGATLGKASATMTIRNDDAPQPQPAPVAQTGGGTGPPKPLPTPQPKSGAKHVVLVQMLAPGQSTVDSQGFAHYKLRCPVPAVKSCQGTIVLEVRVKANKTQASKKAPTYKTVQVGAGKFKINVNRSAKVKVKVSKAGLVLLRTYKRMQVKATIKAKDTQGVKGVTAWLVTVQAPPRSITVKNP